MHERTFTPAEEALKARYGSCLEIIYKIQEQIGTTRMYNLSADYADILIAILNHTKIGDTSLQKFNELPFQGLTILEIGGPFGQILHVLGAEVWCIDPDIKGKSDWQRVNWNYSPKTRTEQYHPIAVRLTANNWQEYLYSGQFDVTYSHDVLSTNSGTSSEWRAKWHRKYEVMKSQGTLEIRKLDRKRDEEYRQLVAERKGPEAEARKDLFTLSAQVTKTGGLILHQGDAIKELLPLAPSIGLTFKEIQDLGATLHNYPDCALYEFVKQ